MFSQRVSSASLTVYILSVALILSTASPLFAAGAPKIGAVNMAVLYNFHPLVQTFVPERGRFMKITGSTTDFNGRYTENRKMISDTNRQISDIQKKITRLDEEKRTVQLLYWRKKRRIETDMDSVLKNPSTKKETIDFSREKEQLKQIESGLFEDLKKVDETKANLENEAKKLDDQLKSINFYTGAEHDKIVARITEEIRESIKEEARKEGMTMVLNTGRYRLEKKVVKQEKFNFHRIYNPAQESVPRNIYDGNYDLTDMIEAHGGLENSKGFLDYQMSLYQDVMVKFEDRMAPFVNENLNDMILLGGKDITDSVLKSILTRYNIEKEKIEVILKGLETKVLH
jgi:predicted  nucleic acid-binding Zn-ribbon protein